MKHLIYENATQKLNSLFFYALHRCAVSRIWLSERKCKLSQPDEKKTHCVIYQDIYRIFQYGFVLHRV